jgi:hypothetical protein
LAVVGGLLSRWAALNAGAGAGSGSGHSIVAPFPLFRVWLEGRRRDFLNQVEGHFSIDVARRVNWILGPTGPEGLLDLFSSAPVPAYQFDTVYNRGRLQFLPKLKLKIGEIRDDAG